MLEEALAINERVLPAEHPDIAITQSGMAVLLLETSRPEQAYMVATAAALALDDAFGDQHWRTAWARALEGASLAQLGRLSDAEPILLDAHEKLTASTGARTAQIIAASRFLVELYEQWGRPEDASLFSKASGVE